MADDKREHKVAISVENVTFDGFTDYEFSISMVEPADAWNMSRPFSQDAWKRLRMDAEVKISIDGAIQCFGYVDDRDYDSGEGTMKIEGRDKGGRLVQESIPSPEGFDGLTLVDAVTKLGAPWFTKISLSDARNRAIRRGKGGRAPSDGEPAIFNVKGKLDDDHSGRVEPGEMRWNVIHQLCSSVSLMAWSSGDGRELVIGKPNYQQQIQYLFRRGDPGTLSIRYKESCRDRYAKIEAHGSGAGNDQDFGDVTVSKLGEALDGPNPDGTGRDFLHPKRLVISQRALADSAEGQRAAQREMNQRNFRRRHLIVTAPLHGQRYRSNVITLFAPNTLARVIDDVLGLDEVFLIYAVTFRGQRTGGETSELHMVPRGTVFIA